MHVPWRFLLALPLGLLLALAFFVSLLYTQLGIPTRSTLWIADINKKKDRLAAAVAGPRLLVVGGSSSLFSINARLIEEETGCQTINLGTHAALGLSYILHRVQKIARKGDTVLLVIEYDLYKGKISGEIFDDYILARDPEYFRQMSWFDKMNMATRVPLARLEEGLRNRSLAEWIPPAGSSYSAYAPFNSGHQCLDEYGDEVFNRAEMRVNSPTKIEEMDGELIGGILSDRIEGFRELAHFFQWARVNQISVLNAFPSIVYHPEYEGAKARGAIETITNFYSSQRIPVLGTAREEMAPANDFFDTFYHLTYESGLIRTERLIAQLKPYLIRKGI